MGSHSVTFCPCSATRHTGKSSNIRVIPAEVSLWSIQAASPLSARRTPRFPCPSPPPQSPRRPHPGAPPRFGFRIAFLLLLLHLPLRQRNALRRLPGRRPLD